MSNTIVFSINLQQTILYSFATNIEDLWKYELFSQLPKGIRRDSDIIIIILRNTFDWLSAHFTFNNPGCFSVIMAQ